MRIDAAAPPRLEDLRKAAQAFEAVFARMLMGAMRATVKPGRLFHGGRGEEVFRDLLDARTAEAATLGIARLLVDRYAKNAPSAESP